jgi:uncharacterized linocin/CFP29 family protein
MNHLLRSIAPLTEANWELLDDEAKQRLRAALAARKLVDFAGPRGWGHSSTNLGRSVAVDKAPAEGVTARKRQVLPLVELRAGFMLPLSELQDHSRGAPDVDLGALDRAAHQIAVAENVAVFHGWKKAGIAGIAERSPHKAPALGESTDDYPARVAKAVELLLCDGVAGPYGLALGREQYTNVVETAEHGGYPLLDHLRKILEGPIVWAPGVSGAVVMSLRGDDYLFESGQDLSIGYERHDLENVHLYLEESFSFVVATPEAAVHLSP